MYTEPLTWDEIDVLYFCAPLYVVFPDGTDAMIQDNGYTLADCETFMSRGGQIFVD